MIWLILILLLLFLGPALVSLTGGARLRGDWSVASQAPIGLAPDPAQVLALTVGLDPLGLAINLPGIGRIGRARRP